MGCLMGCPVKADFSWRGTLDAGATLIDIRNNGAIQQKI